MSSITSLNAKWRKLLKQELRDLCHATESQDYYDKPDVFFKM
jgi:hypothetical protein